MHTPVNTAIAWIAASLLCICAQGSATAEEEVAGHGKAVGGLRIRLQLPAVKEGGKLPRFCKVALENVGDRDLNVKLGFSLANGKSHHPAALRLAVRNGDEVQTLLYAALPGVAGRVDPYVVPLPAGSTYTVTCEFEKYADSETGERIDLNVNDYRIAAELLGEPITDTSADVQGLALVPCWQGKVLSNEVNVSSAGARRGEQ